jgi:hypothetical protein
VAIAFTLIAIDPPAQSPIATLSGPAKSQRYRDGHGGPNRPIVRDVYFDDDGPGEIADVVAIRLTENLVSVTLFHCKFSSGDMPGARVKDLYAVRGQAQKSARWRDRPNQHCIFWPQPRPISLRHAQCPLVIASA